MPPPTLLVPLLLLMLLMLDEMCEAGTNDTGDVENSAVEEGCGMLCVVVAKTEEASEEEEEEEEAMTIGDNMGC